MHQQPFPNAGVEIVDALPMEGVTGFFVEVKFAVGDGPGNFLTHPDRRKNVLPPANH